MFLGTKITVIRTHKNSEKTLFRTLNKYLKHMNHIAKNWRVKIDKILKNL